MDESCAGVEIRSACTPEFASDCMVADAPSGDGRTQWETVVELGKPRASFSFGWETRKCMHFAHNDVGVDAATSVAGEDRSFVGAGRPGLRQHSRCQRRFSMREPRKTERNFRRAIGCGDAVRLRVRGILRGV